MAKSAQYWADRRKKQFGRFGKKVVTAYGNPSVPTIARAAWSGVKYLRTLVNSEVHKLDTTLNSDIDSSGYVTHLSGIAQGDAINNRTGNAILAKYLSTRFSLFVHTSATYSLCRVIFFIDQQQIADTAPAVTDVLTSASTVAHYNANNVGRFKILSDKMYKLVVGGDSAMLALKTNIRLQRHIRYNGSATSDINRGGVYVLFLSSEATNKVHIIGNSRLTWHDN